MENSLLQGKSRDEYIAIDKKGKLSRTIIVQMAVFELKKNLDTLFIEYLILVVSIILFLLVDDLPIF